MSVTIGQNKKWPRGRLSIARKKNIAGKLSLYFITIIIQSSLKKNNGSPSEAVFQAAVVRNIRLKKILGYLKVIYVQIPVTHYKSQNGTAHKTFLLLMYYYEVCPKARF